VVIGRDSASGTRASFEELVMDETEVVSSMLQKNSNGAVHDSVASTEGAIGYVGLGYLDSEVKSVKVNGVAPSTTTVLDGTYPIARSLHFVTDGEPTGLAADFIKFVLSADGQSIVEDEGFVPLTPSGEASGMNGDLIIKGSTTVLPIAQAAASKYNDLYGANIQVSGGGSSVGVTSAADGTADIGMASRDLKSSETDKYPDLQAHVVGKDGIAVIVHPDNKVVSMTKDQVKQVYAGEIEYWEDL
jgi:phosphate transport system substrate-binding protein